MLSITLFEVDDEKSILSGNAFTVGPTKECLKFVSILEANCQMQYDVLSICSSEITDIYISTDFSLQFSVNIGWWSKFLVNMVLIAAQNCAMKPKIVL